MDTKTVFLSGSRQISRLPNVVKKWIEDAIRNIGFNFIVGDANGADKAMQKLLHCYECGNVKVYYVGNKLRNNVSRWAEKPIFPEDRNLKGRKLYIEKDKVMASEADFGLVVWNGKSEGSLNNIFELERRHKEAVVYFSPQKKLLMKSSNQRKIL